MTSVDPRLMANAIRFLSMDAIERAGEGHPGTPLGAADIVTALFTRHLKFNAMDPMWFDRDWFVQSSGHGSMLIYSLLHLTGYEKITLEEIKCFRVLGSHCAGHPEYDPAAGIEVTTGLLGQGIANAAGMVLAETFLSSWFGPGVVDHRTYALVGDGCLHEGVGQEVISLAGHLRLGKLTFLWDGNRITDDNVSSRGAYVLADAEGGPRRATILATGSEVAIALKAREVLRAEQTPTAVVSMPCWELFETQDAEYRNKVIGRSTVRVAVEAGVRHGWERYVGEDGGFVGMTGFGASGSVQDLYAHFGITAEHVVAEVRERL